MEVTDGFLHIENRSYQGGTTLSGFEVREEIEILQNDESVLEATFEALDPGEIIRLNGAMPR